MLIFMFASNLVKSREFPMPLNARAILRLVFLVIAFPSDGASSVRMIVSRRHENPLPMHPYPYDAIFSHRLVAPSCGIASLLMGFRNL